MTIFAVRAADTFLPPALSSSTGYCATTLAIPIVGNNVQRAAVTTTVARSAVGIGTGKKGYVTFQVESGGSAVYVAFKKGTAAASATVNTGFEIPAGTSVSFYMDEDIVNDVEFLTSAGTATLKWYVSSPVE